ncbi:SAV_2336 N-terminal domain-related protein [Embleya sp. NPDC059237]|uniref:SAV_2336 N-terminal domain-related protein n=1 Tax=Embleya sp. NPDC059237 TaxID=3346784 RepID=UPI0036BD8A1A
MAEEDPAGVTVDAVLDWAWLTAVIDTSGGPPAAAAEIATPAGPAPAAPGPAPPSVPGPEPPPAPIARRPPPAVRGPRPETSLAFTAVPDSVESIEQIGTGRAAATAPRLPAWLDEARPPAASILPDRLELARLLRRLRRHGAAPDAVVLDEEATAEHAALTDLIVPVLEPARERWFELALVVDTAPSIAPWRRLLAEFTRLVSGNGTFRAVRSWSLDTDVPGRAVLRTPFGTPAQPAAPAGPTGRRIIMVITDGVGRAWSHPQTAAMLASWGRQCPVVLLNLLPKRWWDRARIPSTPVVFRGRGAGAARRSAFRLRHDPHWTGPPERVAVPLIGLHPEGLWADDPADRRAGRWSELSRWARMITDERGREFAGPAWVLDPRGAAAGPAPTPVSAEDRRTPAVRLAEFRAGASPDAVELLGKLAAAPISPATMRVVQSAVLAREDPAFVAEVMLSGLLVESPDRDEAARPDDVVYDLDEQVRETLLTAMSRRSALEVYFRVAEFLHDRNGHAEFDFQDLLTAREPAAVGLLGPHSRPLARVGATLLDRLGPDYRPRARRLEARANGPMLRRRELTRAWTTRMSHWIRARPVVTDGLIVVQDVAGTLVVLDPLTGMARWTVHLSAPSRCAPVVASGRVWAGHDDGGLYRYDPTRRSAPDTVVRVGDAAVVALVPGPIGTDGLFVATLDGRVVWLDGANDTTELGGTRSGIPAGLCVSADRTAAVDRAGGVGAWHAGSESASWSQDLSEAVHAAPVADEEHVYVPLATAGIAALRWADGEVVWRARLPGGVLSTPGVGAGLVVAVTTDGFLHAFDAGSGRRVWRTADVPQPGLRVTLADGLVHVAGEAGGIRTHDLATGRRVAEIRSDVGVSVAVAARGRLILAGLDGTVTSLEGPVVVD